MRFPFLQQCQLQQPSAGFSILPNPSSLGSNKGTTISIRVTMETKRREQIMVKNNSGEKKVVFLSCIFPRSVHWMVPKRMCTNTPVRAMHRQKRTVDKCGLFMCFQQKCSSNFILQEPGMCFTLLDIQQFLSSLDWQCKLPPQVASVINGK